MDGVARHAVPVGQAVGGQAADDPQCPLEAGVPGSELPRERRFRRKDRVATVPRDVQGIQPVGPGSALKVSIASSGRMARWISPRMK